MEPALLCGGEINISLWVDILTGMQPGGKCTAFYQFIDTRTLTHAHTQMRTCLRTHTHSHKMYPFMDREEGGEKDSSIKHL